MEGLRLRRELANERGRRDVWTRLVDEGCVVDGRALTSCEGCEEEGGEEGGRRAHAACCGRGRGEGGDDLRRVFNRRAG